VKAIRNLKIFQSSIENFSESKLKQTVEEEVHSKKDRELYLREKKKLFEKKRE
jgi:hypothetical protein